MDDYTKKLVMCLRSNTASTCQKAADTIETLTQKFMELEAERELLTWYRRMRSVDGYGGRDFDGHDRFIADEAIAEIEAALTTNSKGE